MPGTFRRDPMLWVVSVVLAAVSAPYLLPILSPEGLEAYGFFYAELPLILVALAAIQLRLRRIDHIAERRFWNLWSAGFGCWLAVRVLRLLLPAELAGDVGILLLQDLLYLGDYLFIVLALETKPHLPSNRPWPGLLRRLEPAGAIVFTFGLLLYFAVIPGTFSEEAYRTWVPSLLLFVVLDGYLVLRLASLRRACASSRWRAVYSWLLAAVVLWMVTDSIEMLLSAKVIPSVQDGTLLLLVWLMPFVMVVMATRVREHELAGTSDDDPTSHSREARDGTQALWGGSLVVYAMAFPLLHFSLYAVGLLDSSTRPVREICALVFLVVLAGMAFVSRRALEVENRRLERARTASRQELLESREVALEASRIKSRFLAHMSHEIRTPLSAIAGMTRLTLYTKLSPEQLEYVDAIRTSVSELLHIVNEILDLSRIEAKKIELEAMPFRLAPLLNETLKMFLPQAQEKGLALHCEGGAGVPEVVIGDPARLRQVVTNLVANAVRFTDKGEIRVRVRRLQGDPTGEFLYFSVADTGVGIAAEDQARIFEAFSQADGSTAGRVGGTGLGLAITTHLVELMGGQMGVKSQEGKGATFHFTVRLPSQPAAEVRLAAGAEALEGLPVLVVHDSVESGQPVLEMLRSWSATVAEVDDVDAALSALRQASQAGTPFPLIVLDESVPGSSELMLARRRSDGLLWGTPRILLRSAGRRSRAEDGPDAAITRSLVRPVTPSDLLDAVQAVLSGHGAPWPTVAPVGREGADEAREGVRGQSLLVLLAEDDPMNARLGVLTVEKLGHRAEVVENGQQALEAFDKRAFDVVLMDVQMPQMDGLEATRCIRERERVSGRHVPIIAITANAMKGDDERCLRAGMDDYLQKPFEPEDLQAALERARIGATTGERAPWPGEVAAFDRARLQRQLGDDPKAVAEVLQIFLENGPAMLANVQEAISSADATGVQQAAHRLKGALLWIAAGRTAKAALALEEAGRRTDLRGAELALETVRREVEVLIVEIHSALRA